MKRIMIVCLVLASLTACTKDEFDGYDTPFVSIATETGATTTVVLSNVNNINTYVVSVSSRPLTEALTVSYEISVGDGLQEGVDYELITTGNALTFEPGVYDMPIRIRWKAHTVDESKDNRVTITLLSASEQALTIGRPGPSAIGRQLTIEKRNN